MLPQYVKNHVLVCCKHFCISLISRTIMLAKYIILYIEEWQTRGTEEQQCLSTEFKPCFSILSHTISLVSILSTAHLEELVSWQDWLKNAQMWQLHPRDSPDSHQHIYITHTHTKKSILKASRPRGKKKIDVTFQNLVFSYYTITFEHVTTFPFETIT